MSDRRSILVVDDSKLACMMLQKAISSFDPEAMITIAMNGVEAMAFYDKRPATIAIVDYNMPGMNGVEMVEALHAAGGLSVPVVMLTTDGRPALMVRAKAAGVKGWIVKPFKPAMLRAEVQRIVGAAGS